MTSLTVRGIPTAPTHDERVRVGKQDRTTWRLFVRDDVSGWDITGPPFPSRAVALSRVDETARYSYGDAAGPVAPDATPPGAWVIGHNIAGYLPESDTYAFASWGEAHAALIEHAREYADRDDEQWEEIPCDCTEQDGHGEDCYGTMRATVDAIASDPSFGPGHDDGRPYGFIVNDHDDRPISFWLAWSPDRIPGEEDPYAP